MKPRPRTPSPRKASPGNGIASKLRKALEASPLTPHRIATEAGLDPRAVGRFMAGERDLTLNSAAALCRVLGLDLADVRKRRPSPSPASAEPCPVDRYSGSGSVEPQGDPDPGLPEPHGV